MQSMSANQAHDDRMCEPSEETVVLETQLVDTKVGEGVRKRPNLSHTKSLTQFRKRFKPTGHMMNLGQDNSIWFGQ